MKPSVLLVITLIFLLAFVSRVIGAVDEVDGLVKSARAGGAASQQAPAETRASAGSREPVDSVDTGDAAAAGSAPDADMSTREIDEDADLTSLVDAIKQRSAEIDRRMAELGAREALLDAIETRARETLAELEAAQGALAENAARLDAASDQDIKALAQMYANMKPAQAGAIFDAMEPSFAAGFLTEIRSENAALILASMDPQKAYAVSVIIAGRNVEN